MDLFFFHELIPNANFAARRNLAATTLVRRTDTQKRKRGKLMAAVSKIFLHAETVYPNGHTVFGAALVYRNVVLPCALRLWASRESCRTSQAEPDPIDRLGRAAAIDVGWAASIG